MPISKTFLPFVSGATRVSVYPLRIRVPNCVTLFGSLFISVSSLLVFKDSPILAFVLAQYIVIAYIYVTLREPQGYIFFLFPLLIAFLSGLFKIDYGELGDGLAYFGQTANVINDFRYRGVLNTLVTDCDKGIFHFYLKYHEFGIFLVYWLPSLMVGEDVNGIMYFFAQTYFHVVLTSILVYCNSIWRVVPKRYEWIFFSFLILSPTFIEFHAAPTRHVFTFFCVALFYFSLVAFVEYRTFAKLAVILLCIGATFLNKPGYLLSFGLFVIYLTYTRVRGNMRIVVMSVITVLVGVSIPFVYQILSNYSSYAVSSSRSISYDSMKFIWPAFKLTAALAAPFPWYKIGYFTDSIYGGNIVMFVMHVLSSLFGFWAFGRMIIYCRGLLGIDPGVRLMMIFGLMMTISVFFGATGFHSYIAIFFPFFSPLLLIRRYNIPIAAVINILVLLNVIWFIAV